MLFERRLREGIRDGSITLAFRRWRRVQVTVGGRYRTGLDLVEVVAIDEVRLASISTVDARRAGYDSVEELSADLRGDARLQLYRLELRRLDEPDPRKTLAASAEIWEQDAAEIARRLARLDEDGAWTLSTLRLIAARPGTRAADLAFELGCENEWLKGERPQAEEPRPDDQSPHRLPHLAARRGLPRSERPVQTLIACPSDYLRAWTPAHPADR